MPSPAPVRRPHAPARSTVALALASLLLAGCGTISVTPAPATPTDFPGLTGRLNAAGIEVRDWVSGDPGCDDPELARTAIRFTASGLDQAEAVPMYLYVFRNRDAWERNLGTVGPCAAAFVTDPETFEQVEESPYVVAGQGPWAPEFEATLRRTLESAAGSGG
jgi:hypothetical protein